MKLVILFIIVHQCHIYFVSILLWMCYTEIHFKSNCPVIDIPLQYGVCV